MMQRRPLVAALWCLVACTLTGPVDGVAHGRCAGAWAARTRVRCHRVVRAPCGAAPRRLAGISMELSPTTGSDVDDASADEAAPPTTLRERLRLFWRLAVPYFEEADGAKDEL